VGIRVFASCEFEAKLGVGCVSGVIMELNGSEHSGVLFLCDVLVLRRKKSYVGICK
jgi:hypothetical protein